jgi:hypothetical protein
VVRLKAFALGGLLKRLRDGAGLNYGHRAACPANQKMHRMPAMPGFCASNKRLEELDLVDKLLFDQKIECAIDC